MRALQKVATYLVEVVGVSKSYRDDQKQQRMVLTPVSFTIRAGGIVGLLGENGAGKSTTLRVITGAIIPDTGSVLIDGVDVARYPGLAAPKATRVSAEAGLYRQLSARENLAHEARLRRVSSVDLEKKIQSLLIDQLGFPQAYVDRRVSKLSRGEQQKIAITRAFLSSPRLIVLDEPTTGLDEPSKEALYQIVRDRQEAEGTSFIITSHDLGEVEKLAESVVILRKEAAHIVGSVREVRERFNARTLSEAFKCAVEKQVVQKADSLVMLNHIEGAGQ